MGQKKPFLERVLDNLPIIVAKLVGYSIESAALLLVNLLRNFFFLGLLVLLAFIAWNCREFFLYAEYFLGEILEKGFDGLSDVINDITGALAKVANGITDVFTFGIVHHSVHIGRVDIVSKLPFIQHMVTIKHICDRRDSIGDEVLAFSRMVLNPWVCPPVRYMYPVDFIYVPFSTLMYPFSFDATPKPGNNCHFPIDEVECELANCYRVLEFFIYLVLAGIILSSCKDLLLYIWRGIWEVTKAGLSGLYLVLRRFAQRSKTRMNLAFYA